MWFSNLSITYDTLTVLWKALCEQSSYCGTTDRHEILNTTQNGNNIDWKQAFLLSYNGIYLLVILVAIRQPPLR